MAPITLMHDPLMMGGVKNPAVDALAQKIIKAKAPEGVALALWWMEAPVTATRSSRTSETAPRDKGPRTWVMIALALSLAGAALFLIARRRRA